MSNDGVAVTAAQFEEASQPAVALTPSASANAVIGALRGLPGSSDVQRQVDLWEALGYLSDEDLQQESTRLEDPDQAPRKQFGSAPRDQVLRALKIERQARVGRQRNKDDLQSSLREGAFFVLGCAVTFLGFWLIGK